jgi:predicted lipid-binding transport protein (Tim44 family)
MVEYRITIGHKPKDPGQPTQRHSKLEMLKAGLLGVLALAAVIGILIAAFIVGSVIASILLILLAVALVVWSARRFFLKLFR